MSIFQLIQNDVSAASKAQQAQNDALVAYQTACIVGDWPKAEQERLVAVTSLEAFLDHIAAAYKEMERHAG